MRARRGPLSPGAVHAVMNEQQIWELEPHKISPEGETHVGMVDGETIINVAGINFRGLTVRDYSDRAYLTLFAPKGSSNAERLKMMFATELIVASRGALRTFPVDLVTKLYKCCVFHAQGYTATPSYWVQIRVFY